MMVPGYSVTPPVFPPVCATHSTYARWCTRLEITEIAVLRAHTEGDTGGVTDCRLKE